MDSNSKYGFHDDYSEGAHPMILEALAQTNKLQQSTYGTDDYSEAARKAIRNLIGDDEAHIYFTAGGTGANILAIASHLRPHEAIIAAQSGHITDKEGGAIEATGHQIIAEPGVDGKLTPELIQSAVDRSVAFAWQPKAKMVYISNATEVGTVYTKSELVAISALCKSLGMLLLMDGARIGVALASEKNDMSLRDIYELTDVFWIGGTKNGALLGEAIVIKDAAFGADFPYHMKQRGMLLAKGRLLGIQFSTLFQDDLFFDLARHANTAAAELSTSLTNMGFSLWVPTESNQVFVSLPAILIGFLQTMYRFFIWERVNNDVWVIRLVTSWATEMSEVKRFCNLIHSWKAVAQKLPGPEKPKVTNGYPTDSII